MGSAANNSSGGDLGGGGAAPVYDDEPGTTGGGGGAVPGLPVVSSQGTIGQTIPLYGGTQGSGTLQNDKYGNAIPQYGGINGGANNTAGQLSGIGAAYKANAPNLYTPGVNAAFNTNRMAQGLVGDAIGGLSAAAQGQTPSAAALGQAAGISGSLGNSYAASKLGPATTAMAGNAGAAGQAVGTGLAGRSNELGTAQQNLAGAVNAQTGQGNAAQGAANQFALTQAGATQQAGANAANMDLYYQQQAQNVEAQQLAANTSIYNTQYGNAAQLGTQQYSLGQQNLQNLTGAGLGGGTGLLNAYTRSQAGSPTAPSTPDQQPSVANDPDYQ